VVSIFPYVGWGLLPPLLSPNPDLEHGGEKTWLLVVDVIKNVYYG